MITKDKSSGLAESEIRMMRVFHGILRVTTLLTAIGLLLGVRAQAAISAGTVRQFKPHVVATTAVLANIAEYIGGDKIVVNSLTTRRMDISDPSVTDGRVYLAWRACVLLRLGTGDDIWVEQVVRKSGNKRIARGAEGDVDCSVGMDQGTERYYWLDPENGRTIALNITKALVKADARNSAYYEQRYQKFSRKLDRKMLCWQHGLAAYRGVEIVSADDHWMPFFARFGIKQRTTDSADGRTSILPKSTNSMAGKKDYFSMFDRIVTLISQRLCASSGV